MTAAVAPSEGMDIPGHLIFACPQGWASVWVCESEYLDGIAEDIAGVFTAIYGLPIKVEVVAEAPVIRDTTEFTIDDPGDPSVGIGGGHSEVALQIPEGGLERVRAHLKRTFETLHDFRVSVLTLAEIEAENAAEEAAEAEVDDYA